MNDLWQAEPEDNANDDVIVVMMSEKDSGDEWWF